MAGAFARIAMHDLVDGRGIINAQTQSLTDVT